MGWEKRQSSFARRTQQEAGDYAQPDTHVETENLLHTLGGVYGIGRRRVPLHSKQQTAANGENSVQQADREPTSLFTPPRKLLRSLGSHAYLCRLSDPPSLRPGAVSGTAHLGRWCIIDASITTKRA